MGRFRTPGKSLWTKAFVFVLVCFGVCVGVAVSETVGEYLVEDGFTQPVWAIVAGQNAEICIVKRYVVCWPVSSLGPKTVLS
jgi:hypothetical protein